MAKKKEEKLNIKYRVVGIKTIGLNIEACEVEEVNSLEALSEIDVDVDVALYLKDVKEGIIFECTINSSFYNKTSKKVHVKSSIKSQFEIVGLIGEQESKGKTSYNLPEPLILNIVSIAYSQARGVLSAHLAGTEYDQYLFLPLVPPAKLLDGISSSTEMQANKKAKT